MHSTKKIIIIGTTLLSLLFIFFLSKKNQPTSFDYTVGILQTASHPALDAVASGCKERLKTTDKKIQIIEKNGQGNTNTLHVIAHNFERNNNLDALVTIATPATQAAYEIIKNKTILYAAVSDPKRAGIQNNQQINGVVDAINFNDQIALMKTIAPEAKTVGLLYNKGEINALSSIEELVPLLKKEGYQPIQYTVTNESEIPQAVTAALNKAEIIFTPIDNTVAATIDFIAQKARDKKIPLIVSDNLLVDKGALVASGVDYYKSGQLLADQIIELLINKKEFSSLTFDAPTDATIHVNKKVADELGISLENLKKAFPNRITVHA